jgi:NADPH-dependent glutamate synthase beta subunit-like oxidoreductase
MSDPRPAPPPPEEHPIIGWARAIVQGIGDTAKDALEAGRQGAREAHDEAWERYEAKTKHRRRKP